MQFVIHRNPNILFEGDNAIEVWNPRQSVEEFFQQNFVMDVDVLAPTPYFRNSHQDNFAYLFYNGPSQIFTPDEFNTTMIQLYNFLHDTKIELAKHNISMPLRLAFRDEHMWIGHQLRLLREYWPEHYDTFTPAIQDQHSRNYVMEVARNVTLDEVTPQQYAQFIMDYLDGHINEYMIT